MNTKNEKSLDELNAEIEEELLQKLESQEESEDEEVTISMAKFTFDIVFVALLILFIITNIGVIIWKLIV